MKIDKLAPEEQAHIEKLLARRVTPTVVWRDEKWLWFDTNDTGGRYITLLSADHTRMVRGVPIDEVTQ